jgi:DNA-binding HxlR family transcriptional regulator
MQHNNCPITYAMKVIGGKWKPIIFMRLSHGVNRFGILSRSIDGISKNMLTRELRELESHKIISRKIFPEIPPRVEYSITKKGKTLLPVFEKLGEWGKKNLKT